MRNLLRPVWGVEFFSDLVEILGGEVNRSYYLTRSKIIGILLIPAAQSML
jgi:hypothetical protein